MPPSTPRRARAPLSLLLCAGLALVGCKPPPEPPPDPKQLAEGKYLEATSAYLKGDFDAALLSFAEVRKASPDDPRLPAAIGEVYLSQGKLTEAREQFEAAAKLDPKRATTWSRIGFIQAQKGERAEARVSLEKALALNPKDFNAHEALAELHLREKEWAPAAERYAAAARAAPERQRPELYLKGAQALEKGGLTAEAIALIEQGAKENVLSVELSTLLGDLRVRAGALEAAEQAYREAAAQAPKDPMYWQMIAQIEAKLKRPEEAERAYAASLQVKDRTAVHVELARLHLGQGHREKAVAELEKALAAASAAGQDPKAEPDPVEDTQELAELLATLGRKPDALQILKLLSAEPDAAKNADLHQRTAALARELKDAEAEKDACARFLKERPGARCP